MTTLRTPFPYPGGKSNIADWILDQFPTDYRRYVEVFGGAASGRAASAGWLKVVYRMREKWIGNEIGVSEDTVVQYLSDLREGRR